MTERSRRVARLAALVAICSASVIAARSALAAESRRWILSQPDELRDLYLDGELSDSRGNRWSVAIVPGVRPQGRRSRDGFRKAGDAVDQWTKASFWQDRQREFHDGVRFAVDDMGRTLIVDGIRGDWRDTRGRVAELRQEKPFAWLAQLAWQTTTGYVILPLGRVTLGAGGAAGGVTYAAVEPAVASSTPGCTALAWAGGKGLVFPAAMILLHQPAYLLAIMNAEPLERHNGRFGLRIIAWGADA